MSYIEGAVTVYSYWLANVVKRECLFKPVQNLCKDHDSSLTISDKLAYEASSRISVKALRALLKGLYEIILDSRSSKGDILAI